MQNNYREAIKDCIDSFSSLEELYDILVRGTCIEHEKLTDGWSDIDITLIFNSLCLPILKKINLIYSMLEEKYSFKISITILTKKDFFSKIHHHGIKPLYYNHMLAESISVFNRELPQWVSDVECLQFDCLSNIAYLIHDLRSRFMKLRLDSDEQVETFSCHLLKRTKHLIRNIIFIQTGYISEDIERTVFKRVFPHLDLEILSLLESYKRDWNLIKNDLSAKHKIIEVVMAIAEEVYETNCSNYNVLGSGIKQ